MLNCRCLPAVRPNQRPILPPDFKTLTKVTSSTAAVSPRFAPTSGPFSLPTSKVTSASSSPRHQHHRRLNLTMAAPLLSLHSHHHHHHSSTAADADDDFFPVPPSLVLPAESFLNAAISLKDQVVEATWRRDGDRCADPTVYSGAAGTAFACLRSYEVTGNRQDLLTAAEIVGACAEAAKSRGVTFLCGRAGIYALGAVITNYLNDRHNCSLFLNLFLEVAQEKALSVGPEEGGFGMSYELLYGRAGFLWSALFINKYLVPDTVPGDLLVPVVEAILAGGRAGASNNTKCPLMYRWHGTSYWGAAHGLAGILHVLLHFPLHGHECEEVKRTLRYMIANRLACSGNYPSSEANPRDQLVHWSHGAGGVSMTLCKAAQAFPEDKDFYNAAIEAGDVIWRKGLLNKVGLGDGTSGNAYSFLSLYRLTGEEVHLERAKSFASFLFYKAEKLVSNNKDCFNYDNTYSLYEGLAGTVCLWLDLVSPQNSRFPGFEL